MTGPEENSEFCFPETLSVPQGEAEGTIEVEGKRNSLFPEGPVIKCFVIRPDSNTEKKAEKNDLLAYTTKLPKSRHLMQQTFSLTTAT